MVVRAVEAEVGRAVVRGAEKKRGQPRREEGRHDGAPVPARGTEAWVARPWQQLQDEPQQIVRSFGRDDQSGAISSAPPSASRRRSCAVGTRDRRCAWCPAEGQGRFSYGGLLASCAPKALAREDSRVSTCRSLNGLKSQTHASCSSRNRCFAECLKT